MVDGTETGAAASKGGSGASSPIFLKGFLPGLLVGLVVGLTLGAVVPPLLDARGPRLPEDRGIESPAAPSSREREDEREGAFEGTGLPFEDGTAESEPE